MRICVVGAGLGGLTVARILHQRGAEVVVCEASDGVGGRVRSDVVQGFTLDRGFQVVFDAYPGVRRQLHLPSLDLRAFDPGAIICRNGRRSILTDPLRDRSLPDLVHAATTTVVSPLDKLRTLRLSLVLRSQTVDAVLAGKDAHTVDFLRQQGFSNTIIDQFFRPFYGGIFLDRSLQTSAKCFKFDFKMLSDGRTAVPARGMGQISEQLAQPLVAAGLIRLSTPVVSLQREGNRVRGAILATGEIIAADAVVIATPAPQAAVLTGLPMPQGKRETITVYFYGDAPVYRGKKLLLNANDDAFVNNAQMMTNIAPEYAPAGQHLLSATILGQPASTDTELYRRALADVHRMLSGDAAAQATLASYQPLACYRIPYAQFDQPPGLHPNLPDNRTSIAGLYFSGEFTEASSLNAAMISGEKCAAAILSP